jgi:hypothetical protein
MYKVEQINEDTLKLTKLNINKDEYDKQILENGDMLLVRKRIITINGFNEFNNLRNQYNLNNSNILSCVINYYQSNDYRLKYKSILNYIYSNIIKDGFKIIRNSILNISTIKKETEGFYYMEDLGISIQGVDSNKCLHEIINQCHFNNIHITILIRLMNGSRIEIKLEQT